MSMEIQIRKETQVGRHTVFLVAICDDGVCDVIAYAYSAKVAEFLRRAFEAQPHEIVKELTL